MKKILLLIISIFIVVTFVAGCNDKMKERDTSFRTVTSEAIKKIRINEEDVFAALDIIDDDTIETRLGINKNYVTDYAIVTSLNNYSDLIALIKKDNDNVDTAIKALDLYIEGAIESFKQNEDEYNKEMLNRYENVLKGEYKGYQMYIISGDNANILKEVKKLIKD